MTSAEYHKIYAPFKRDPEAVGQWKNRVIYGLWSSPEFEYLQDRPWVWTEKLDGTNVRVHWDGHDVSYAGRTDKAQLPTPLQQWLNTELYEEKFEEVFKGSAVTLYGEGLGGKIQSGSKYCPTEIFVLVDVLIDRWWLTHQSVDEIASSLGIIRAPLRSTRSLWEAIYEVEAGMTSVYGDFFAEGVVGTPTVPLFSRSGERIITKVKHADFYQHPGWR